MNPYNSIYDTYDTSGTIDFFNLVSFDITQLFNTNNVNKTKSLSNIYTYKKYKAINEILYVILFVTILILLLTILNKYVEYFDNVAYSIIIGVIIAVTFIYILQLISDILFRNNINYDEYQFEKPKKDVFVYTNIPFKSSVAVTDESKDNKCNKK